MQAILKTYLLVRESESRLGMNFANYSMLLYLLSNIIGIKKENRQLHEVTGGVREVLYLRFS